MAVKVVEVGSTEETLRQRERLLRTNVRATHTNLNERPFPRKPA
jgi:hypothetical protein